MLVEALENNKVRKLLLVAPLMLLTQAAIAQVDLKKYSGHTYAYWSLTQPFDSPGTGMSFGGGGEAFVYKGLSLGGDIAYAFPTEYPSEGIGMLSLNPAYHFLDESRSRRLVPFVTGGYTLGFRSGVGSFFNYGGGITYWFSRKVGMRVELRDQRYIPYPRDSFVTLRVGFSFR